MTGWAMYVPALEGAIMTNAGRSIGILKGRETPALAIAHDRNADFEAALGIAQNATRVARPQLG